MMHRCRSASGERGIRTHDELALITVFKSERLWSSLYRLVSNSAVTCGYVIAAIRAGLARGVSCCVACWRDVSAAPLSAVPHG